jgi:hypothetical protein
MTEQEWLACDDPTPMLEFLEDKASERKLRLFAVACCRSVWLRLPISVKETVVVLERYLEGKADIVEYNECWSLAGQVRGQVAEIICRGLMYHNGSIWYSDHFEAVQNVASTCSALRMPGMKEWSKQTTLFRDIFGNAFRPISLHPSWLTSSVVLLATGIYTDRAFDRMPILADALQDAGCDNEEILNHCRQPGKHVRGCFVVDVLLGKG